MTMEWQNHYPRKACRRVKLHPLLSMLHLNFVTPLSGQSPWSIYAFKVFVSHTQFGAMQVSVPIVLDCLVFLPPTQDKVNESHPLNPPLMFF